MSGRDTPPERIVPPRVLIYRVTIEVGPWRLPAGWEVIDTLGAIRTRWYATLRGASRAAAAIVRRK